MSTRGQIKLRKIKKLLKECAPGFTWRDTDHKYLVRWNDHSFWLPKGAHGSKREIEVGHVKGLVRSLGIDPDCAKSQVPALGNRL